jgi:hypothetical protein
MDFGNDTQRTCRRTAARGACFRGGCTIGAFAGVCSGLVFPACAAGLGSHA